MEFLELWRKALVEQQEDEPLLENNRDLFGVSGLG